MTKASKSARGPKVSKAITKAAYERLKRRKLRKSIKKGKRSGGYGSGAGNADAAQMAAALSNPFSPGAIGVRVADAYTIATATYHIRSSLVCFSSGTGVFSAAILPSPALTHHTVSGTVQSGSVSFTQNSGCGYLVSPTAISNLLTEYRTVAWGIRLVAKDTAFNSKGKVYIAAVPTTENAPSWNTMETVTGSFSAIGEYLYGVDANFFATNIPNLPNVKVFSMQDLLRGEVMASGVPTNQSFYQFKGTHDRSVLPWNSGATLADEAVFNTTGLVNATAAGRKDVASLRGGRAFLIHATGMPIGTNEFDLEIIYHLEGTPNLTGTASATLAPSSMRHTIGNTPLLEKIIATSSIAGRLIRFATDPENRAAATKAVAWVAGRAPLMIA